MENMIPHQIIHMPERRKLVGGMTPQQAEEYERLEDVEDLRFICEKYGYKRVGRWVRNLAKMHGEEA